MARQGNIFLIALACSLGLHLLSFSAYVEYSKRHMPARPMPVEIASTARLAQTQPTTAPAETQILVYPEMGDDAGTGIGSNSSPGDRPMKAREADEDQALLSRDPTGSGRISNVPTKSTGPTGDGHGGTPAVALVEPPTPQVTPPKADDVSPLPPVQPPPVKVAASVPLPRADIAPIQSDPEPKLVEVPTLPANPEPTIQKIDETAEKQHSRPQEHEVVAVAKRQPATGDGRTSGTPQASSNPLPQSESDSDPFSRISSSAVFRDGKLQQRRGRKVKTTRIQIGIAGMKAIDSLGNPKIVLEIHISPTGSVTDVTVAHSTGMNEIDEPTRLAVYDWWFEPAKDKKGKPVSDVIFFTIEFVG